MRQSPPCTLNSRKNHKLNFQLFPACLQCVSQQLQGSSLLCHHYTTTQPVDCDLSWPVKTVQIIPLICICIDFSELIRLGILICILHLNGNLGGDFMKDGFSFVSVEHTFSFQLRLPLSSFQSTSLNKVSFLYLFWEFLLTSLRTRYQKIYVLHIVKGFKLLWRC